MNLRLNASKGKIEMVAGMYLSVFLVLVFSMQIQLYILTVTGSMMEDALAASNLASAVIDVREYGISHTVQIASPDTAYLLYREALQQNLGLKDNWEHRNQILICGPITVRQYIIYNVKEKDIDIYSFGENGPNYSWTEYGGLGRVQTPDGILIESTSVYSQIEFNVKGILGMSVLARKEKTVDIVSDLIGEEIQ